MAGSHSWEMAGQGSEPGSSASSGGTLWGPVLFWWAALGGSHFPHAPRPPSKLSKTVLCLWVLSPSLPLSLSLPFSLPSLPLPSLAPSLPLSLPALPSPPCPSHSFSPSVPLSPLSPWDHSSMQQWAGGLHLSPAQEPRAASHLLRATGSGPEVGHRGPAPTPSPAPAPRNTGCCVGLPPSYVPSAKEVT